ncbi:hypothetical protein CDD81_3872 [Ophiocordyceps australis]|uniref:Phosphotransferase n=1 Tax=Ophiocordyceps australis TaxID=1399860 RepID=A0A2C5YAT0_9HYPO|nr:hypothetical protein CDD81_3872 [Ophiocordyceps australis]
MAATAPRARRLVDDYLAPFDIDVEKCNLLSHRFLATFAALAAESHQQFLPTPISESILQPIADHGHGRHLAIDIGGTNLRVGFIELLPKHARLNGAAAAKNEANGLDAGPSGRIRRQLEQQWCISNHLKTDNAESLFVWIGGCIAQVVARGCREFGINADTPLPLGVTFSFPTEQHSLCEATITSMGKGFAIPPDVELGARLQQGYSKFKTAELPPIQVVAIANDSVATLVSFIFSYDGSARRRAAMGLIVGTGSNATVPLRLDQLHPDKRQQQVSVLPGDRVGDVKIAVNTEWSINGTEPPMRQLGLITPWDDELSCHNELPGFQPLEYMTAGRYLGELGRIVLLDYLTKELGLSADSLPTGLRQRHGLTTTFLSHFRPLQASLLVCKLRAEFPECDAPGKGGFVWTEEVAEVLYHIAKAIEVRAAGIMAAGIMALLTLAGDIPAQVADEGAAETTRAPVDELGVGYTGGCIVHFHDYLVDCQRFVDELVATRFRGGGGGAPGPVKVALHACHDGGIMGAGILAAAALSSKRMEVT